MGGLPFLAKDKRDPYEPSGTKWTSEIAQSNLVSVCREFTIDVEDPTINFYLNMDTCGEYRP